ncbi:hypothetical protein [Hymenobacter elongatus]|uniref:Uncharacterized protein n=1 Tax=Hymenobacter elongatus TaxID=877208 RepID=A0A4Z0PK66_9BACT|nr:hypothetical protein [Hymenobacter elongatus]TGE15532.1 hypothetical protein E5J99_12075 [Hymenobacter elongatus]
MKKLTTPAGIIFGLLRVVYAFSGDWLPASINGLLAAGFLLSDMAYAPATGSTTVAAPLLT